MMRLIHTPKNYLPVLAFLLLIFFFCNVNTTNAQTFSFGASGDHAFGANFKATVAEAAKAGLAFQLALGNNSYANDKEQAWCDTWRSQSVPVALLAGHYDVLETNGGNIDQYITYCPFPLTGLQGIYGKRYYFDYPSAHPFVRFIMIDPGVRGSLTGFDTYFTGGDGYLFTEHAIDDARVKRIPWVIVGMHKNYISSMEQKNEVGPDIMNLLFNKRVDLILQAYENGYERTKQLICATVDTYDPKCVVDVSDHLEKGAGTVIQVLGNGGQGLLGLDTGDPEYPYFAKTNNTTYGFGKFIVSQTQLSYIFVRSAGEPFNDNYTINGTQMSLTVTPTPTPTPSPICPAIPLDKGIVTLTTSIPEKAEYRIWSRIMIPDAQNNAYYLQVDDQCPVTIGDSDAIAQMQWTWVGYRDGNTATPATFLLAPGAHILKLIGKEAGVKVDRLLITPDLICTPVDAGNNCLQPAKAASP